MIRRALPLLLLAAAPARAADTPQDTPPRFDPSGFASIVSDYRFRGVSRTRGHAAVQAQARVDTLPGWYGAVWGSSVAGYAGADAEVDVYGGWTRTSGGWTPDAGVYAYLFPGGSGADFYEVYGALTRDLGPAGATVGVNYAPPQRAGHDNVYVYTSLGASVPGTPVSLKAGLGYEDGFGAGGKLDWSLGATVRRGKISLGASYVDSDRGRGHDGAGVVVSLTANF